MDLLLFMTDLQLKDAVVINVVAGVQLDGREHDGAPGERAAAGAAAGHDRAEDRGRTELGRRTNR